MSKNNLLSKSDKSSKPEIIDRPPLYFDPNDEIPEEDLKDIDEKVEKKLKEENSKELNLMKSLELAVPGQNWVLVSFTGASCRQKTEQLGMKIWGCFNEIKEAKDHADKLSRIKENNIFDIFILEMYTWAIVPPDPQCMDDQVYHEEKLHNIITDHRKEQLKAKEVFDMRKERLKNNPDFNQYNRNKQVLSELMNGEELKPSLKSAKLNKLAEQQDPWFRDHVKEGEVPDLKVEHIDENEIVEENIINKRDPKFVEEGIKDSEIELRKQESTYEFDQEELVNESEKLMNELD